MDGYGIDHWLFTCLKEWALEEKEAKNEHNNEQPKNDQSAAEVEHIHAKRVCAA